MKFRCAFDCDIKIFFWVKFLISCSAEVGRPIHMSGINLGVLNHKELTEIVKFDSSTVINAVWRSLAVHCHTEWWGVVSLGMVTVKGRLR